MAFWDRKPKRRSLTAAATRVTRENTEMHRRLRMPRQVRSLEYYDSIGEVWYAAQFYARALSRLDLYVGVRAPDADPNEAPEPSEDPALKAALTRIQDPGGGRVNLLGAYGRLRFLIGEAYLVCTGAKYDEDITTGQEVMVEAEKWEMLSIDEVRLITGGGYQRLRAPGLPMESFREPTQEPGEDMWEDLDNNEAVVYRLYKPHPRYSELSDGPMFAVLDICEELLLLTLAVRSRAVNRAAGAGILYLPDEISFPEEGAEADEDPEEDPFMKDLTEALTTPLKEPGDASAVVPMVVRGPAAYADALKLISLKVDGSYPEQQLRQECIERLATGLDMPREALLGLSDVNHWNAWQIDEDTWKAHLEPVAMELCQDLTAAYLRPYLLQENGGDMESVQDLVVWYDATRVINHPDKSKNALEVHDRAALSDEALRRETGFDETDEPSEEERARRIGILVRDGGLAITGVPTLRSGAQPEEGVTPNADTDPQASPPETPEPPPSTPEPSPRDGGNPSSSGPPPAGGGADATARLIGGAELAVEAARAKAGARLRQALRKSNCEECLEQINGVPNRLVPAVLGTLRATGTQIPALPARELVGGSMEPLLAQLIKAGYEHELAGVICRATEEHAAQTLFEDRQVLSPTVINLIRQGMEARV